jgi:hypothetical protein
MLQVEGPIRSHRRITTIPPLLRKQYALTVTSLKASLHTLIASGLWVSRLERLEFLSNFVFHV